MTTTIPRSLVAEALGVGDDMLPPGDLPLSRFAERFLTYLRDGVAADEAQHPDAWTFLLFDGLVATAPELAIAALRQGLIQCATPDDVALIAAGPLDDLIARQGMVLIGEVEALAAQAPRFAYALTGVSKPEDGSNALLWARIEAARRGVAAIDDGAPLPADDGL